MTSGTIAIAIIDDISHVAGSGTAFTPVAPHWILSG
jgi:hypothetical protein